MLYISLKMEKKLSPTPDGCCPLLALMSIQLMTCMPRPRYSALQLLGKSGACGSNQSEHCCVSFAIDLIF